VNKPVETKILEPGSDSIRTDSGQFVGLPAAAATLLAWLFSAPA
jgi:hypothetical protein